MIVDAIYQGERKGSAADDPLPRLLGVSNQGGFRYRGSLDNLSLVVLKTSLDDPDWPGALDREAGTFVYAVKSMRRTPKLVAMTSAYSQCQNGVQPVPISNAEDNRYNTATAEVPR